MRSYYSALISHSCPGVAPGLHGWGVASPIGIRGTENPQVRSKRVPDVRGIGTTAARVQTPYRAFVGVGAGCRGCQATNRHFATPTRPRTEPFRWVLSRRRQWRAAGVFRGTVATGMGEMCAGFCVHACGTVHNPCYGGCAHIVDRRRTTGWFEAPPEVVQLHVRVQTWLAHTQYLAQAPDRIGELRFVQLSTDTHYHHSFYIEEKI